MVVPQFDLIRVLGHQEFSEECPKGDAYIMLRTATTTITSETTYDVHVGDSYSCYLENKKPFNVKSWSHAAQVMLAEKVERYA